MRLLIKNGRVVDPANNLDAVRDVLIENGKISRLGSGLTNGVDNIIDAKDKVVLPGLVDMHVHLREPGREDKETVFSGTRAALKGGVTSLLAMPNTLPAIDSAQNVRALRDIIQKTTQNNVFMSAAITKGREGRQITDIAALKENGVVAITDDGASVDDEQVLAEALSNAKKERVLLIEHCEDKKLSNSGVVNLGFISTKLGLRGIPKQSEYQRIQRDIELCRKVGAAIHIAHVSCGESVEIIAKAKKSGIQVTCETAPHYFALSQEDVVGYNTNMKMSPPLRSKDDVAAIKQGLKDATIDVIASDHAPHTANEKDIEFERAEFGAIGLETELAVSISELIATGLLNWQELVKKIALNPSRIIAVNKGTLSPGADADVIVVDPDKEWVVEKGGLVSKSKNSAFLGRKLKGIVEFTIYRGTIAYQA